MTSASLRACIAGAVLGIVALPAAAQCYPPYCYPMMEPESAPATSSPGLSSSQQQGTVVAPLLTISRVLGMIRSGGAVQGGVPGPSARSGETGLAGAVRGARWNGWAAVANSRIDYQWAPLASSGDVTSLVVGGDYRLSEKATLGLSIAADETHIDTRYNNGRLTGSGINLAPYFAWQFDEAWSLDASAGVGRATPQVVDNLASTTGSTKASRQFGALNVTYSRWAGNWEFSGKGTLLHTREEKDPYRLSNGLAVSSSTTGLGQVRLAGQIAYLAAGGLNPYAGLAYVADYHHAEQAPIAGAALPANDRDGWVLTIGANLFSKGALSGGVQWQKEDRRQLKLDTFLANIAIRF